MVAGWGTVKVVYKMLNFVEYGSVYYNLQEGAGLSRSLWVCVTEVRGSGADEPLHSKGLL